jgi:hypothetical protein
VINNFHNIGIQKYIKCNCINNKDYTMKQKTVNIKCFNNATSSALIDKGKEIFIYVDGLPCFPSKHLSIAQLIN